MNANGLVLVAIGVWVIVQVFKGDALRRLGLVATAPRPGSTS